MHFADEPDPGEPLPVLPGHSSPGRFERVLRAGGFTVTASIDPPVSASPAELFTRAHALDGYVDALAVDHEAIGRMGGLGAAALLARRGYAVLLSFGAHQLESEAFESEILAASALGIASVLCGPGESAPDSIATVREMRDHERFPDGRRIVGGPRVFAGASVRPGAGGVETVADDVARLVDAGAQFVVLDGFLDLDVLDESVARLRAAGLHDRCFLIGGLDPAAWIDPRRAEMDALPGAGVPHEVIARIRRSSRPRHEARRLCMEALQRLRDLDGIHGVHVRAPGYEEAIAEIVDAAGVLASRVPWHPARGAVRETLRRSVQ